MVERSADGETILVIGYGNELRGDDGIGARVAEDIAAANYPGVRVRSVCQLVPELAAEVAEARMVIFVDALAGSSRGAVELAPVEAEQIADWCTHSADPRTLLALTRVVYARTPEAWWLTVSGRNFDFGEGLSSTAEEGVRQAVAHLKKLICCVSALWKCNRSLRLGVCKDLASPGSPGEARPSRRERILGFNCR